MLKISNLNILNTKIQFDSLNLAVAFLVPTETGMVKSIMDAHLDFRSFLKSSKMHDYTSQAQGQKAKVILDVNLHANHQCIRTQLSLFKPKSKQGDPRAWVYGLKKHAAPTDLIAFVEIGGGLEVINCSSIRNIKKYLNKSFIYQTSVSNHLKRIQTSTSQPPPKGKKIPKKAKSKSTTYVRDPRLRTY